MDIKFLFYVFLSIVIIAGGTYQTFSSGADVAAALFFFGSIMIILFFGFRWFTPQGAIKQEGGPWPPLINYCPDFLSLHTIGTTPYCVDTVGVTDGGITRMTDPATQTDEKYLFNLFASQTGDQRIKSLCDQCAAKKVTWEGVYNGVTCLNRNPPLPPTA